MDLATQGESPQTIPGPAEDHTATALEFVHGLLRAAPAEELDRAAVLCRLARAFGAAAAGMAAPLDGPAVVRRRADGAVPSPSPCPWEKQPALLTRIRRSSVAVEITGGDGAPWLAVAAGTDEAGWLLWVERPAGRAWHPTEAAALALAGAAIGRLAAAPEPNGARSGRAWEREQLHRHLEGAALLTGKLAHDFGNVLTGILGFAELTLPLLPAGSTAHRYVNEVWQAAQAGAGWVEKLRLFSRRRGKTGPAAVAAAVAAEEARVRSAWGDEIAFHVAMPTDLPPVAVAPESVRQILAPLLDNAREALLGSSQPGATTGGVVTLSARVTELTEANCLELVGGAAPGRVVEVAITDTGSGLSAEARRRLFHEPFYSARVRHRGLGLAIVYGVLQSCGGGLRFGPDPVCGTAVRVFLPVAAVPQTAAPKPDEGRTGGERILVVDDDPLVLRFVSLALEGAGYRTQLAADGAEALAAYGSAEEPFRLVVTDVLMPRMDGYELARRLRGRDPDVNLLFISCEPAPAEWTEDGRGACGVLPKPFRPETLLQAVRGALDRPRPHAR